MYIYIQHIYIYIYICIYIDTCTYSQAPPRFPASAPKRKAHTAQWPSTAAATTQLLKTRIQNSFGMTTESTKKWMKLLVQLGLMGIVQLGLMGITWYNYDCKPQLHNCFDFQFWWILSSNHQMMDQWWLPKVPVIHSQEVVWFRFQSWSPRPK